MKKFRVWLIAILMAVGSGLVAPGPASAAPYCGLVWGSLMKDAPRMSAANVTNVRTGQHYCFDRLVIDLNGPVSGYTVRYVPQVTQDGSGLPVPLRGQAFLQVTVNAPAYDGQGNATYARRTRKNSPMSAATRPSGRWHGPTASRAIRALASASGPGCRSACSPWPGRTRAHGS